MIKSSYLATMEQLIKERKKNKPMNMWRTIESTTTIINKYKLWAKMHNFEPYGLRSLNMLYRTRIKLIKQRNHVNRVSQ